MQRENKQERKTHLLPTAATYTQHIIRMKIKREKRNKKTYFCTRKKKKFPHNQKKKNLFSYTTEKK